ncbi:membrane protease YdiL (CAAX protease family) [Thermocatellispora tengchongensis]|uniref:Membrane protease YdiL (CAAX protease family) n=1 Tax=Thermocatellispora tengchongensis TaxID=1073253 RepID=A0A840P628_9ACTN|nr:CPBP family intramembrane glutamic endopeptidase [Thermocatellispora tengchongensis]MBB5136784.1 membrane protease YdiL (CAAX protease family) [Thermocatellispora tengchongensis]
MLTTLLAAVLAAYLAVVCPLLGRRSYARLLRERDRDPNALTRAYAWYLAEWWTLAAAALLVVVLSPGIGPAAAGLALPADLSTTAGMLTGFAVVAVPLALVARRMARAGVALPGQAAYRALLPRTPAERRLALAVAVTAGICEEIVYRGLLIALGTRLLGLPVPVAAALALAVFVAGHLYQGWRGMALVTLLGFSFTVLYLQTGSLLLPIVLHILADVRGLLLVPRSRPDGIGRTATVPG